MTTPAATMVAAGKQPRTANMAGRAQTAVDTAATVIAAATVAGVEGTPAFTLAEDVADTPAEVAPTLVAEAAAVTPAAVAAMAGTRAVAAVATPEAAAAILQAVDTVRADRITKLSSQPKQ